MEPFTQEEASGSDLQKALRAEIVAQDTGRKQSSLLMNCYPLLGLGASI